MVVACAVVGGVLAWMPGIAGAQPAARRPVIGLLSIGTDPTLPLPSRWQAFFEGLRTLGWVDGQNVRVERRFSGGDAGQVSCLAVELAQLGVDVIVATGLRENQALQKVTRTVVFLLDDDDYIIAEDFDVDVPEFEHDVAWFRLPDEDRGG
jgi:putative ABC transport system substrate-binding protein